MLPVWPARAAALQEGTGWCRPHSSPAWGGPPRWALLHRGRVPTRHGDTGGPTAAESRKAWPLCSCPAFSEPMKDTGHGGLRGHSRWGHPVSGSGACRLPPPPEWKRRGSQPGWGTGLGPRPPAPLPWTILCTEGAGQHPGPPRRTPPSMASLLSFKHLLSSEYVIVQSVFDKAGQDSLKQASTGLSQAGSCVLNSAPRPGGPCAAPTLLHPLGCRAGPCPVWWPRGLLLESPQS